MTASDATDLWPSSKSSKPNALPIPDQRIRLIVYVITVARYLTEITWVSNDLFQLKFPEVSVNHECKGWRAEGSRDKEDRRGQGQDTPMGPSLPLLSATVLFLMFFSPLKMLPLSGDQAYNTWACRGHFIFKLYPYNTKSKYMCLL